MPGLFRPSSVHSTPILTTPTLGIITVTQKPVASDELLTPIPPITPSPPPSSRATSASCESDESTLSIPDPDQGPVARRIRGWMAFSNLTYRVIDHEVPESPAEAVEQEVEEEVPPPVKRQRTGKLCGLCLSTKLIGGRQYCAKCSRKQLDASMSIARETETPGVTRNDRNPTEIGMLKLWEGERPELDDQHRRDVEMDCVKEFLQVVSDVEDGNDGQKNKRKEISPEIFDIEQRLPVQGNPRIDYGRDDRVNADAWEGEDINYNSEGEDHDLEAEEEDETSENPQRRPLLLHSRDYYHLWR